MLDAWAVAVASEPLLVLTGETRIVGRSLDARALPVSPLASGPRRIRGQGGTREPLELGGERVLGAAPGE